MAVHAAELSPELIDPLIAPQIDNPAVTNPADINLSIRLLMQGKEVGSIIGKKGEQIKRFRDESQARINISDGSTSERVVSITGTTEIIHRAFTMICKKFEEDLSTTPNVVKPPVTLKLIVPATQCGVIIGRNGSKIKEIRDATGASIQVSSDHLPNSSERAVTISGTADALADCILQICQILRESPPRGFVTQYRPRPSVPQVSSVLPPGATLGQTAPLQPAGLPLDLQIPAVDATTACLDPRFFAAASPDGKIQTIQPFVPASPTMSMLPLANNLSVTPLFQEIALPGIATAPSATTAYMIPPPIQTQQEISIPNDLIGCIIGRSGNKINEIRQLSGAGIKICNTEDNSADRKVLITGTYDAIQKALYHINLSKEAWVREPIPEAEIVTSTKLGDQQTLPNTSVNPSLNTLAKSSNPSIIFPTESTNTCTSSATTVATPQTGFVANGIHTQFLNSAGAAQTSLMSQLACSAVPNALSHLLTNPAPGPGPVPGCLSPQLFGATSNASGLSLPLTNPNPLFVPDTPCFIDPTTGISYPLVSPQSTNVRPGPAAGSLHQMLVLPDGSKMRQQKLFRAGPY